VDGGKKTPGPRKQEPNQVGQKKHIVKKKNDPRKGSGTEPEHLAEKLSIFCVEQITLFTRFEDAKRL
jgi:hypothetical protein